MREEVRAQDVARSSLRDAARLLWTMARPERRQVFIGTAWLIVAAGLEALGPILAKRLIDEHLLPRQFEAIGLMAALLAAIWVSGLAASGLRYLQLTRMAGVAQKAVLRLRAQVFQHVLALPMAYFDKQITGALVSRVTNDTESVNQLYRQVLYVMLDSSIVVAGTLVAMAFLDWRLMLIIAALVPAMVLVIWAYQRLSAPAVAQARALKSDINAQIAENLGGLAVLQASGALGRFQARFANHNDQHYRARMKEMRANAWLLRPALDLLNVLLMVALILGYAQQREVSGLEVGLLYAFLSYLTRVVEPLIQITLQFGQLQQALVAAARVGVLLQEAHAPLPAPGGPGIERGEIRIEQLRAGYGEGADVLHPFDLTLPAGSFVGLVGHTGSGKSTLLALLLRFYAPRGGRILVDGQPLETLDEARLRHDLALVPQEPQLLSASAWDNLRMGRTHLSDATLQEAARQARLHEMLLALPQGYDTLLGEGGVQLSTGQKQLLAMARALAGSPKILLLDEATANIDSGTEALLGEALSALRGRITVIAVAHRLSTIRAADPILVLHHGHLVERGTHEALMAIPGGVYQRLVQLQQLAE
ncbi:ATP-binding cassette domain-containing protein [Inhella sp. 1Y17]|uniref:ATP-binding cassette domain-containing protein n=2 Tax=Inhella proteolytica TaxID=2795029 RepID=A0A931J3K2_9BURK|nr:ATP-binding cassette domain-containing protein [Inhella proteolytica]